MVFVASGLGYFVTSCLSSWLAHALGIGLLLAASTALMAAAMFGFAFSPLWGAFVACVPAIARTIREASGIPAGRFDPAKATRTLDSGLNFRAFAITRLRPSAYSPSPPSSVLGRSTASVDHRRRTTAEDEVALALPVPFTAGELGRTVVAVNGRKRMLKWWRISVAFRPGKLPSPVTAANWVTGVR